MIESGAHTMKLNSLFCVIFGLFSSVQSLESGVNNKGCVGINQCCEFKETEAGITCARFCEPRIHCATPKTPSTTEAAFDPETADYANLKEVVEEQIIQKPATFALSMNTAHICRKGFRLDSFGKCRRVLGPTIEKTTESQQ